MTRLVRTLLGEAGFERAAVWSATGFALSIVALRAAGALGSAPIAIAVACTAVVGVGVAGFTRVDGGLLPSVLLAYGPVSAALLEILGPRIRLVAGGGIAVDAGGAGGGPLSTGLALAESLAFAVAGAVALGVVGFLVGRGLAAATGGDAGNDGGDSKDDAGSPTADADD
ncbi:hypothetical protein [Halorubrum cibi]|uniref:Uncharacterized protein n=1 Tax=Halorubrum cibi TaxID=413815 RepID=A0A521C6V2_9EURY|nr:hypothetical protein [Halorubrum cibi]SMO54420.1 hypothetical protein SAMN06264867_103317 [Halorubrum cibi]